MQHLPILQLSPADSVTKQLIQTALFSLFLPEPVDIRRPGSYLLRPAIHGRTFLYFSAVC